MSLRGEYELPTAVETAMRDFDVRFRVVVCRDPVLDLSSRQSFDVAVERSGDRPDSKNNQPIRGLRCFGEYPAKIGHSSHLSTKIYRPQFCRDSGVILRD